MSCFGLTISLAILGPIALAAIVYGIESGKLSATLLGPCSLRVPLARHTMGGYCHSACSSHLLASIVSGQTKRSTLAMEYSRRGYRCHIMGSLDAAASGVPGAFRFFKDLWKIDRRGHTSALALSHGAVVFIGGEQTPRFEKAAAKAGHPGVRDTGEGRSGEVP